MPIRAHLRALLSLPLVCSELLLQISELNQRLLEQSRLQRELIQVLSDRPAKTPELVLYDHPIGENGDLPKSSLDPSGWSNFQMTTAPTPRDPHRLRTDKDVTFTSDLRSASPPLPRG